ncbi:hypothetical protein DVH24_015009 [Malus domestica]|uniref:Leucine-rich repeat-containing N-terminal plant-type domain-containing protein n=1 Tax=Malus domestica TaxID=3750 RepID=A0A498K0I1_MALDO|nr:hypothetical protein DVH24_015009 [Malus domestica]
MAQWLGYWVEPGLGLIQIWAWVTKAQANALQSLRQTWSNVPPSWGKSNDPCGERWDGITCNGSRVTELGLSGMNVKGKIESDIVELSELRSL